MGRLDVRDPVADRLARRLLQRPRAELDRAHLGAEQAHALDVGLLALHVLGAHVDDALHAEARADGRSGDAVLAGAGLGHDALLLEPPRDQRLPDGVVDLVRAGVAEILALEVDAPARRRCARRGRAASAGRRRCAAARSSSAAEGGDRPGSPPSRARAPRAPGIERLGDVLAAVGAVDGLPQVDAHAATASRRAHGLDEGADLVVVLDPGGELEAAAGVDAPGRDRLDRGADVLGPEAAGEDHAALDLRGRLPSARVPARARGGRARSRRPRRSAGGRRSARGGRPPPDRAGRGRFRPPRPRRRRRPTESIVSGTGSGAAARRGLSARMKPARSAPASAAAATSSSRVSPQTFTSGRAMISASLAPGSSARMSVEPTRIASRPRELGLGALGAVADRALGDDHALAGRLRDERELGAAVDRRTCARSRALIADDLGAELDGPPSSSASWASTSRSRPSVRPPSSMSRACSSSRSRSSSSAASAPAMRACSRSPWSSKKPLARSGTLVAARAAARSSKVPPKRSSTRIETAAAPLAPNALRERGRIGVRPQVAGGRRATLHLGDRAQAALRRAQSRKRPIRRAPPRRGSAARRRRARRGAPRRCPSRRPRQRGA